MKTPTSSFGSRLLDLLLAAALGLIAFGVFLVARNHVSFDSRFSMEVTDSILREGNIDLDEYPVVVGNPYVYDWRGHKYWRYPIGVPFLVAPLVAAADRWLMPAIDRTPALRRFFDESLAMWIAERPERSWRHYVLEKTLGAFVAGLSVAMIFVLLRTRYGRSLAVLATVLFAFGTSEFSVVSRGLMQHHGMIFMLAAALWALIRAERRPWLAGLSALPLAIAYTCRPTAAVPILVLSIYVAIRHTRQLPLYAISGLLVAVPFCALNYHCFDALLPQYYLSKPFESPSTFWVGVAANTISPSRGLFVFSPFLLFALPPLLWLPWRRWHTVLPVVPLVVFLHLAAISGYPCWWAGSCYGPRFMSDLLPIWMLCFCEGIVAATALPRPVRITLWTLLALTGAFAVLVHTLGAVRWECWMWGVVPDDIDVDQTRLWSWRDPQVLSGILR